MPGLGRRFDPDPRDQDYPMRAVLRTPSVERYARYWWSQGAWYDQGATGTCVGHAWAHWMDDGPVTHEHKHDPYRIYLDATKLDVWPENDGGDLNFGTSVRAAAKGLVASGQISEYRWAWDAQTVVECLLATGPVVVGTVWYEGMFETDSNGFIHPTGPQAGGHAYLLNGVNTRANKVRVKNSWGRSWGRNGYAWLQITDLDALIKDQGEACLAVEVPTRTSPGLPGR